MLEPRLRHWISSVSLDRALAGVEGGFIEAGPGRDTRLRRLARGDGLLLYSARTEARTGRPLQQFTALGWVADDEPHRAAAEDATTPWRRRVEFEPVVAVPVRPLLPLLGFVDDKERWSTPLRSGLLEVAAGDFAAVAGAMRDAASGAHAPIGSRG